MEAAVFILLQFLADNFFKFTTPLISLQNRSLNLMRPFLLVSDVIENLFNTYSNFQKIVGWALSTVVCAWNVRKEPKTRKQKIVGWVLSIVVGAWNVRNKPKTRKQKIVGCTLVGKLFVPDVIKNLFNSYFKKKKKFFK